jgi:hypothetical protein
MHPSYMGPSMPRPARERLTPIPGGKLDVALGIYRKELGAIVERQNNLKRVVNAGGRPKPFSYFVGWAQAWLSAHPEPSGRSSSPRRSTHGL